MNVQTVELTTWRAAKVAWAQVWRMWIVALAINVFLLGYATYLKFMVDKMEGTGTSLPAASTLVYVAALATQLFGYFHVFRTSLRLRWPDFELVALAPDGRPLDVTYGRALTVYGSFAWRMILGTLGCVVVLILLASLASMIGTMVPDVAVVSQLAVGVAAVMTFPILALVYVLMLRFALRVRWSDFHFEPRATARSNESV